MSGQARVTVFAGLATLLAAMSLTPVFQGSAWFWPTFGTLLLVGGIGIGLRRRPNASWLVLVVQLAVVTVWLTWLYADNAVGGLLPGPGALRDFGDLLSTGAQDARDYGTPVPMSRGLELMTVLGTSAVAIVVDALAATYRRAALAGLPLLALYTVPASVVSGGLHATYFVLAALGYIGLLIAEGRDKVSRWGRPLIASASIGRGVTRAVTPVETAPFAQVGRRVGAAVIGLAVAVPALLPITDSALTGSGSGLFGNDGDGEGPTLIDPVVSLRRDFFDREARTVMTVATDDPRARGSYYRMATLDQFDGEEWRRGETFTEDLEDAIGPPVDLSPDVPTTEVRTRIETTEFLQADHLPVPYPVIGIEIPGSWVVDLPTGNILSERGASQLSELSYETTSLSVDPTAAQLASASTGVELLSHYLELPDDLPAAVRDLALQITEGSQSPWDSALRLQAWFTDPTEFTYDTSSSHGGWGGTAIERFLTDRRGYCEQFAGTMATMARVLNIPSRVNIGFTAGERLPDGRYEITTKDLHAWPELYFEGIGWLRFEPTPIAADGRGSAPTYAQADSQEDALPADGDAPPDDGGPTQSGQPTNGANSPATIDPNAACSAFTGAAFRLCVDDLPSAGAAPADGPLLPPWAIAGGLVALVGALTPAGLRMGIRRRRYRQAGREPIALANAAWAELRDNAVDLGYAWPSSETPRQSAARLARTGKLRTAPADALSRLTTAIERARYAPAVGAVAGAAGDVRTVRDGLAERAGRWRRTRAHLLPASTVAVAHWIAERFADMLDWFDRLTLHHRFRLKGPFKR